MRGFDYHVDTLCRRDPAISAIVARHGRPRYPRRAAGVKGLVRIILEQQVSMAAAYTLYRRLDAALGGITAKKLAETGQPGLRALGLTRQKARYCHTLGAAVHSRQLSLTGIARLPDEAAMAALVTMPGIGAWSAA
ncbi:MAG: DNA-3-methyladenine glycosylase 2 family protein, partial [Pseudomonadota bacterium]